MSNLNVTFVNRVVENCINLYKNLPKSGKPVDKEWTVLSCIVQYDNTSDNVVVVALGTGSKCIGASKMSSAGDVLNDSHAEVIARRSFLVYLYDNIEKVKHNQLSIFSKELENGKYKLKENIQFLFYSSQLPCGDACIIPKLGDEEHFGDILQNKRKQEEEICDTHKKKQKFDEDVYRTGGKCLPSCEQDPRLPGKDYHVLGQVRTKPGRGDRTLSASCSDKIARWIHLGIQGNLLNMLCGCIYIKHFIFGAGVPYSEESLCRATLSRHTESSVALEVVPNFYQATLPFPHIKTEENLRPASGSIAWVKLKDPLLEVAVQGKKLGVTKKKAHSLNSSLFISKYNIYKRFLNILHKNEEIKQNIVHNVDITSIPYNKMKSKSEKYLETWDNVKQKFFKTWTIKPDIWNFCVNATSN